MALGRFSCASLNVPSLVRPSKSASLEAAANISPILNYGCPEIDGLFPPAACLIGNGKRLGRPRAAAESVQRDGAGSRLSRVTPLRGDSFFLVQVRRRTNKASPERLSADPPMQPNTLDKHTSIAHDQQDLLITVPCFSD